MESNLILQLEEAVEQLLERLRHLRDENEKLKSRQQLLEEERGATRGELKELLTKLERLERGGP